MGLPLARGPSLRVHRHRRRRFLKTPSRRHDRRDPVRGRPLVTLVRHQATPGSFRASSCVVLLAVARRVRRRLRLREARAPRPSSTTAHLAPRQPVDGTLTLGQLAPLTGSLAPIAQVADRPGADRGQRDQRRPAASTASRSRSRSPTTAAARTARRREHVARRPARHQEGRRGHRARPRPAPRSTCSTRSGPGRVLSARARTRPRSSATRRLRRLLLPHRAAGPAPGDRARPAGRDRGPEATR